MLPTTFVTIRTHKGCISLPHVKHVHYRGKQINIDSFSLAGVFVAAASLLPRRGGRQCAFASLRRRKCCIAAKPQVDEPQDPLNQVVEAVDELDDSEWCAFAINLERRKDRWENLEKVLSVANPKLLQRLERIDAVDGRDLDLEDGALEEYVQFTQLARARRAKSLGIYTVVHDKENWLVHFDDHLTEGAIACAMSHHKALERVAEHPTAEWGLILEDDVSVVVPHVDKVISRLLRRLPEDWEAVYLGYHDDDGKPHPQGQKAGDAPPLPDSEVVESEIGGVYSQCWGLFAWIVRKDTARMIVDTIFPLDTQIDGAISNLLVHRFGPGRIFKVPPEELIFYSSCSEEAQDSDIQTMKSEDGVIEEYGSWGEYMQQTRSATRYDDMDMEDLYGGMFDEYGGYGSDSDSEDFNVNPTFDPYDFPTGNEMQEH